MTKRKSESSPMQPPPPSSPADYPPQERLPDFIGLEVLPSHPRPSDEQQNLYKELWNKVAWAMGSAYNCPYRGQTQIRSLARRLVMVVIANESQILPPDFEKGLG